MIGLIFVQYAQFNYTTTIVNPFVALICQAALKINDEDSNAL